MPPQQNAPVPPVTNDGSNDRTMAIIAYILFFVPLIAVKNRSAYLNFHVNQGLILLIVAIVGNVILSFLGWRFMMFINIWDLLMVVLAILGILSASKNEMKPLPVIGTWLTLIK